MASPSLQDLLTEEGFKGRKSTSSRPRSSFGSAPGSMPLYLHKDHQAQYGNNSSLPSGVKVIKPQRARSDVSKYKSISELPRPERVNYGRARDNLLTSERIPRGEKDNELFGGIEFSARRRSDAHESERFRDIYLNDGKEIIMTRGESFSVGSNSSRDREKYRERSSKNLADQTTMNENFKKSSVRSKNYMEIEKSVLKPALDEVANKAMVSILNSYITRFLKDKEFRDSVHGSCVTCLNSNKLKEENRHSDNKVISNFEEAMETVERYVEEDGDAKELKKACLQLSVVTSLNLKDLKDRFTSGVPNSHLSACAHMYLSVIYKLQKKEQVSAKHLLQVFCDSPNQARTLLLHELWDSVFLPNFLHLNTWYNTEVTSLPDTLSKARKLKLLDKVHSDMLDSGTHQFAVYYKDWLTEGVEPPTIPSIHIPPVLLIKGSSRTHSPDILSPSGSASSQPKISRKLYDEVFGQRKKTDGIAREEEQKFDTCISSFDNLTNSFDTTEEEKKTLVYSPGQGKHSGEPVQYNINGGKEANVVLRADVLLPIAADANIESKNDSPKEDEIKGVVGNTHFWRSSSGSTCMLDILPPKKSNELTLKKLAESVFYQPQTEDFNSYNIPISRSHSKILMPDSYANRSNRSFYVESERSSAGQYVNDAYVEEESFFSHTPKDFICPLTRELFEDPVTLETGETFERTAIIEWLSKGNKKCPTTGRNLECLALPITNMVLKRVIDSWKSEHCRNMLSFASKIAGDSSFENGFKSKDERAVSILEQLLVGFKTEERLTNAKHLISLGGLQFLVRRFEFGNLQEKFRVVALLLCCIEADGSCRNYVAKNINKECLVELLHNKQSQLRASAVLLLTELICLNRRADILAFLSSLQKEGIMNTMHVLLVYLQSSTPDQRPLVAVLLIHFDFLVEPRKYSIYREEAVDSISMALESSLTDEKVREHCCRALLILGGQFSFTGELLTENWLLRQAGFYDGCDSKYFDNSEEHFGISEVGSLEEEEEKVREEWWKKLATILLGNGKKKSFLEMISICLGSGNSSLVRMCLITVAWISHALTLHTDTEFQLSAFSALVPRLKENLESGEWVEHRVLASMTLLNFTKISECRVVLMAIGEEMVSPLQSLAGVTWTAKVLLALISGESV